MGSLIISVKLHIITLITLSLDNIYSRSYSSSILPTNSSSMSSRCPIDAHDFHSRKIHMLNKILIEVRLVGELNVLNKSSKLCSCLPVTLG